MPAHPLIKPLNKLMEAMKKLKKDKLIYPIRFKLEVSMQKAFREQGTNFIKKFAIFQRRFVESLDGSDIDRLFDNVIIETLWLFETPFNEAAYATMAIGAKQAIADIGMDISFNVKNSRAQTYLNNHAAEMVTKINKTTKAAIKNIILESAEGGWSYDKTAKEISKQFKQFAIGKPQLHIRSRAHLVAVTESGNGYVAGYLEGGRQMKDRGIQQEKKWYTVGDQRVSAGCDENESMGWIDIDDLFESGHDGPLRFPGCRCDITIRTKTE